MDLDSVLDNKYVKFKCIQAWKPWHSSHFLCIAILETFHTPIQENFIYKKQGPSPISLVRAARIFSNTKTLKKNFDLLLDFGDNSIYPF